jgi:ribosome maturation factor RimP
VGFGPLFCFRGFIFRAGAVAFVREAAQITEAVRSIAAPITQALSVELVDVVCTGQGGRTVVRVYIDKPGGVTVGDCEQVHLSLGHALDVGDPIPHAYTLEVSSPGLDRPFTRRADYERSHGKLVRIKRRTSENGKTIVIGRLSSVDETGVTLSMPVGKQAQPVSIPWAEVVEARLEVEF